MTHVPYKSTPPALADLISGHVQIMVGDVPSSQAMIRAGKVRAVGMTTAQRHALLPDLATFSEQGSATPPDMGGWWCAVAPAGTPGDILDRLNKELVKILETESVRAKMLQNGLVPMPSTRQQAVQYQKDQFVVWKTIVKDLDLKAEWGKLRAHAVLESRQRRRIGKAAARIAMPPARPSMRWSDAIRQAFLGGQEAIIGPISKSKDAGTTQRRSARRPVC